MGCTTAGEIGKGGYLDHSITALGLPRNLFRVAVGYVASLRNFDPERARAMAFDLRAGLTFSTADWATEVAFLLTDGLSLMEDQLVWTLSEALGQSPLVGGSAGDGLRFGQTFVLVERRFRTDAAVLAVLRTPCTVTAFRFRPSGTDRPAYGCDASRSGTKTGDRDQRDAGRTGNNARIFGKRPQPAFAFHFRREPGRIESWRYTSCAGHYSVSNRMAPCVSSRLSNAGLCCG